MLWWRSEREWYVEDWRGREWRFRALEPDEIDFAQLPFDLGADPDGPIQPLIDEAFNWSGAKDDRLSAQLLAIYDRVTGRHKAAEVPRPTNDPQGRLRGFRDELERALSVACQMGVLTYERIRRPTYEFPIEEPEPEYEPLVNAPEDPTDHFLELQVVSVRGDGIPGIACKVTLPSGTILQGTSGPGGLLRLSEFDESGAALVTFPDVRPFALADARGSSAGRLRIVQDGVSADVDARTVIETPPQVYRGRLIGMFFDKSKSFLLPTAMHGVRGITRYLEQHAGAQLLVVGHTDRTGSQDYNLTLSVERAESVSAFLRDDSDAWVAWFDDSKAAEKRWGTHEIQLMLSALPSDSSGERFYREPFTGRRDKRTREALRRFQAWRNQTKGTSLPENGELADDTRAELIRAYMELEGTSVPDETVIKTHGCGEFHPQDPTPDGVDDPDNRRVEIFVFDDQITPAPVTCRSPGCSQYAQWLDQVVETIDFGTDDLVDEPLVVGRLPSIPTFGRSFPKPATLPMLRAIASELAAEPNLHALIVGHTDHGTDVGEDAALALDRARAVAALLLGDADFFRDRFQGAASGAAWDWEEVQWMLFATDDGGDPFYAGLVDGHRGDATISALESFQLSAGLPLTHVCDDATLDPLIARYQGLIGSTRPDVGQITAIGGGSWHPPRTFGSQSQELEGPLFQDNRQPGFRRVEIFLARGVLKPDPSACAETRHAACEAYRRWCVAVIRELEPAALPVVPIRVTDGFSDPLPGASVSLRRIAEDGTLTAFAGGTTSPLGLLALNAPPGFYAIEARAGAATLSTTVRLDADQLGGIVLQLPMSRRTALIGSDEG